METFATIVDKVRKLSIDEIEELERILQKDRVEKSRKQFAKDHKNTLTEYKAGKLKFSADINVLKEELGLK